MQKVFDLLEKLNIGEEDLPKDIQSSIDKLDERTSAYNDATEEYEKTGVEDAATEARLDEEERLLDEMEVVIVNAINAWKQVPADTKKRVEEEKEKSGRGIGWFVFGAAVLVLSFGAANVFNKE